MNISYEYKTKSFAAIPRAIRSLIRRGGIRLILASSNSYRRCARDSDLAHNTNIMCFKADRLIVIDHENLIRLSKREYKRYLRYYILYGLKSLNA